MRILVDALSVAPGGGATVARELLRELGSLDATDRYAVLVKDSLLPGMPGWPANVTFERIGRVTRRASTRTVWEQSRLPALILKEGHDVFFGLGGFGMLRPPVPQVVIVQNALFYGDAARPAVHGGIKKRAQREVQLRTLRSGATGVCVSESIRRLVAPLVSDDVRLVVIPNGVTVSARPSRGNTPDSGTKRILWVGSEAPHKNPADLLNALQHIDQPLEVVFAGIAPEHGREMLVGRRNAGMDTQVRFLGPVPRDQLGLEYQAADVYVSTSFVEASSLTALEAMAAGTPLVLSDIPAHRETAPHTEFYPPGEPEQLAAGVTSLLRDPVDRSQMIAAGMDLAAARSWKAAAAAYRAEFARLAR